VVSCVVLIQKDLENNGEQNHDSHVNLESQIHRVHPNIHFKVMGLVGAVQSCHLMPQLREHPIGGENLVLVNKADIRSRVIEYGRVDVVLALPLFLNDSVHDSSIKQPIHIELVKVPKTVISIVVSELHEDHHLIGVVVDLQALLQLLCHLLFHQVGRVLRI